MSARTAGLFLLFAFVFAGSFARAAVPVPAPPDVAAKNYILVDYASGNVLAEKGADEPIEPASITKLMTAYVVYHELAAGRLSEDDQVTISEKAWRMGGSRMYLEVGSTVSVRELLKGLIIQSGNDASVALAEHIAGTEDAFVSLMNQYAAALRMDSTHFVNCTGWPDKAHLSTARDIATLSRAIIREFPEHYKLYAEKEYTYNNIKQYNRNKLLWSDATVDGLKTGHTESAGYCLVASAKRADTRLISVVLGTKSKKARASVSQALLNYGFRFYETHLLYSAGETLARPRIWKGELENVAVGLPQDLYITIPRGAYKELNASMDIDKTIEAPVQKGDELGEVKIRLNGELLDSTPLIALQSVEKGNIIQVIKDYFLRLLE
ncbi:MAG TPA: D-alanyl-D-alanine carboxypeptidase [Thiotrichales bacterium]|nr:D-alanyl-D-alanine carboxypeptidase [Thiotrichales bacterium]